VLASLSCPSNLRVPFIAFEFFPGARVSQTYSLEIIKPCYFPCLSLFSIAKRIGLLSSCSTYCTVATVPIEAQGNQTEYAQRPKPWTFRLGARQRTRRPATEDSAAVGDKGSFISLSPLFQYIGTQITPDLEESSDIETQIRAAILHTGAFMVLKDAFFDKRYFLRSVTTPQTTLVLVPTIPMLHLCFSRARVYPTLPSFRAISPVFHSN
jgi:hypothetical protein